MAFRATKRPDWQSRIKNFLMVLGFYITISGLSTFSLFICEEAFQTVMFATWASQDAQDWPTVKTGIDLMESMHSTLTIMNNCFGWIQPLAFISYRAYAQSEAYYIRALTSKVLANAPQLFVGERISFTFIPKSVTRRPDGTASARHGRIYITVPKATPGVPMDISGVLRLGENGLLVLKP